MNQEQMRVIPFQGDDSEYQITLEALLEVLTVQNTENPLTEEHTYYIGRLVKSMLPPEIKAPKHVVTLS